MVHRRMRQLSLTETETFVNLAKHALETLNASDEEEETSGKDRVPPHYSDEANDADDRGDIDAGDATGSTLPTSFKTIQSEPVFKNKRKRLGVGLGMGHMDEVDDEMEMDNRWLASPDTADDDILHFVARSTSDMALANPEHRDDDDDADPSGDETTHLARAKSHLLC